MAKAKSKKARYSKGWETRRKNAAKLGTSPHKFGQKGVLKTTLVVDPSPAVGSMLDAPVTTDTNALLAAELINLATTKRCTSGMVHDRIAQIRSQARYEGQAEVEEAAMKRLKDVQARTDERIVCGFVATVDLAQRVHNGLRPDMMFSITSFEAVKIVDALNRAGYSANGRNEGVAMQQKRDAIMGRSHDERERVGRDAELSRALHALGCSTG